MVREADAAAVVVDVAMSLSARGYDVQVAPARMPRLVRLGVLMLAEFGLADRVGAASGDGDDQALISQQGDGFADGAACRAEFLL